MKKRYQEIITAIVWIFIWQIVYVSVGSDILVPSPSSVLFRFLELSNTSVFWVSIVSSLFKIVEGFTIGFLIGTIFAFITAKNNYLKTFFSPLLESIKAVPVASFIILAVIWLSPSNVPILTSALVVLPNIWANVEVGIKNVDKSLLEMGKLFGFSKGKMLKHIIFPSLKPYIDAAIKNGMGMAWKAGIAAEVICPYKNSIGYALHDAKIYLETCDLVAWTLAVVVLSFIFERIIILLLNKESV